MCEQIPASVPAPDAPWSRIRMRMPWWTSEAGTLAGSPASTPVSSTDAVNGPSVVVTRLIRSEPGTKRQPDPGTIGATGNSGGTLIQPSPSGVMLKTPDAGLLIHTGITSTNGGAAIGRVNEPMLVAVIWPAVTAVQPPVGAPLSSVATVSNRYSISG